MSILELGALGEFVGSIAVLATLAYLAVQVRHSRNLLEENRKIALSQVYQARMDSRQAIHIAAMDNGVAAILAKQPFLQAPEQIDLDQLTDIEKQQLSSFWQMQLLMWDNNYYQESLGLLKSDDLVDKSIRERTTKIAQRMADELNLQISPGLREYWKAEGFS